MNWHRNIAEQGSTTIELIVVLGIIAIMGVAVFSLGSSSLRAISNAQKEIRDTSLLMRLDDAVRKSALSIRVPLWAPDLIISKDDSNIFIPYYRGVKENNFSIIQEPEGLTLKTADTAIVFSRVSLVETTILKGPLGESAGLSVTYKIGDRSYHTTARFGATALGKTQ